MPEPRQGATLAAMRGAGCQRYTQSTNIYICRQHSHWNTERDVCEVVDAAVKAGWEAAWIEAFRG